MDKIQDINVINTIDELLEKKISTADNENKRQYYMKMRTKGSYEEFLRLLPFKERMRILNSANDKKKDTGIKAGWVKREDFPIKNILPSNFDFSKITPPKFNVIAKI